jgi:hypothetical protein
MVRTCTGNFCLGVPEASGACGSAAPTGPYGSHAERAHVGAKEEPCAPWRPLATPPVGVGLLLHRLPSDAPYDVRRGVRSARGG